MMPLLLAGHRSEPSPGQAGKPRVNFHQGVLVIDDTVLDKLMPKDGVGELAMAQHGRVGLYQT